MGRRIPAGTGFEYYRQVRIPADEPPPPPPPTPEELELEREMEDFVEPVEAFTRAVGIQERLLGARASIWRENGGAVEGSLPFFCWVSSRAGRTRLKRPPHDWAAIRLP